MTFCAMPRPIPRAFWAKPDMGGGAAEVLAEPKICSRMSLTTAAPTSAVTSWHGRGWREGEEGVAPDSARHRVVSSSEQERGRPERRRRRRQSSS
jgi:hypothetical protein